MSKPTSGSLGRVVSRREALLGGAGVVALTSIVTGCKRERPIVSTDDVIEETDKALVKYHEAEQVAVQVPSPAGIATSHDGSLWVAGDRQVVRLAGGEGVDRSSRGALPSSAVISGEATCMAAGLGALFIGVGNHVEIVRPNAERAEAWEPFAPEGLITCIALGPDTIYLADSVGRRIVRCDPTGKVIGYMCEKDPKRGYSGLIVPSPHLDVVVDEEGAVHVVNPGAHKIEIYEPDGSPRWSWGEDGQQVQGFCGCCNPTDIALLPDGRYVTSEKGIPRVKIYSKQGHFECVVAGHEDLSPGVVGLDVAVMSDGRIAVLDKGINAVRVYEPKGQDSA